MARHPPPGAGPPAKLSELCSRSPDCLRLRAAIALRDLELDPLPFFKGAVAIHLDGGEVHKHVPATVDRDEAVALVRVEPLDGALSHSQQLPNSARTSGPALPLRDPSIAARARREQDRLAISADRQRPETTLPRP